MSEMRERLMRHRVGVATVLAALGVAVLTLYAVPLNPPLGDCFGGLLSQDPLHCYALEQSDRQGIIDVQTVYDADGVLYFSLQQDRNSINTIYEFIKAKLSEFYDRWPNNVPVDPFFDECLKMGISYRHCYLREALGVSRMPKSMVYDDVRLHTGGESARRSVPGWASWRQVWPAAASGASGASGSSTTPSTFDVSDVDMTNLPVVSCNKVLHGIRLDICSRDRDVALSVVARHAGAGGVYFQIKDPPEDKAKLAALKEVLFPCYDKIGPCTYTATTTVTRMVGGIETHVERTAQIHSNTSKVSKVEIIPVKYGPGELVRWAEILDRFATSTGNTIGIAKAEVDWNRSGGGRDVIWPLDSLGPAVMGAYDYDMSTVRETIVVWGFNAQRIADGLPTLLPLLGIPVDAVGSVRAWENRGPDYMIPHIEFSDRGPGSALGFVSSLGIPPPLLLLARNVGVVLVVGGAVALVLRLRRRRAPG